ncbi:MAG: SRPBCC domain-containing protein [Gemmatimonadaceae bacterium]|nr:SRPBCC domain-containing protein [Gemmatimonadaceae bacterium]
MSQTASPYEAANEIRITRVYDAPVSLVWDAWTKDEHVGQWWGPRGFSLTTHSKDLRPGGTWVYTMHGPDGKDWPNFTRYHEVEPRAKLVYDHGASSADAKPMFRVTATFKDIGGKTELDMRMTLATAEEAAQARAFVKSAGGNGTWDRLAEFLEKQVSHTDVFVINRSFDAPIDRMFDLWTKPEHFARWLPPTGMTMTFHRIDIRSGGEGFYSMRSGDFTLYGKIAYQRIERPHLLAYTQCFTDAEERLSRHPMAPLWPAYMHTTVQLTAEGPSRTRVTIRWQPDQSATPEEIAAFVAERGGMTVGWTGSFDKLEALVAGGEGG